VWLVWGDGSAGYSIAEFDTFARHKVPVIALIGNDACWTQIAREQTLMLGSRRFDGILTAFSLKFNVVFTSL